MVSLYYAEPSFSFEAILWGFYFFRSKRPIKRLSETKAINSHTPSAATSEDPSEDSTLQFLKNVYNRFEYFP